MNIDNISIGKDVPNDFNVVIEISANAPGIKYELDKDSGAVFVDRFIATPMHYPCNYGFIPSTLSMCWLFRRIRCRRAWSSAVAPLACWPWKTKPVKTPSWSPCRSPS